MRREINKAIKILTTARNAALGINEVNPVIGLLEILDRKIKTLKVELYRAQSKLKK